MTNLEKIRQMSVKELKLWIRQEPMCDCRTLDECNCYSNCDECFIDWCEEEAKE